MQVPERESYEECERKANAGNFMEIGVDDWIEQQLHPKEISGGGLDSKLAPSCTLKMQTREL
jgi:hypothetical protein